MDSETLLLAAAAGAASLAVGLAAWAMLARRSADAGARRDDTALAEAARQARAAEASAEAFETAVIQLGDGPARLLAGTESLAMCAERLGARGGGPDAVVAALRATGAEAEKAIAALVDTGAACAFEARARGGGVTVEGRASG